MEPIDQDALVAKYLPLITIKARYARIRGMETGDLVSELYIALAEGIDSYDRRNGASEKTFVNCLLENKLTDLARHVQTKKRSIPVFSQIGFEEGVHY
jgi:DNA-directed RNA polymerase specialized sigma subunit